jgi:hypothetical protein
MIAEASVERRRVRRRERKLGLNIKTKTPQGFFDLRDPHM